jgi:hypothetical protein
MGNPKWKEDAPHKNVNLWSSVRQYDTNCCSIAARGCGTECNWNPEDTDGWFLRCIKFKMHISQDEREFVCLQNQRIPLKMAGTPVNIC